MPVFSDYMALNPLIQTNIYRIQPYRYRYLSIDSPYSRQVKPLEFPDASRQAAQTPSETTESQEEIEETEEITEEISGYEDQSDAYEIQYEDQYESQDAYQQEYDENQNGYYQEYEETAFHFSFSEQRFVAQQVADLEQIVVNVGGLQGGIFVHENKNNKETPYTVIFLSMESDGNLWAYTIQTSFDIRRSDSDAVKNARILYEKALETKANLKKFTRVRTGDSETGTRFFK